MGRVGRIKTTREQVLTGVTSIVANRVADANADILTAMRAAQQWPEAL